jgi:hypothetical protein
VETSETERKGKAVVRWPILSLFPAAPMSPWLPMAPVLTLSCSLFFFCPFSFSFVAGAVCPSVRPCPSRRALEDRLHGSDGCAAEKAEEVAGLKAEVGASPLPRLDRLLARDLFFGPQLFPLFGGGGGGNLETPAMVGVGLAYHPHISSLGGFPSRVFILHSQFPPRPCLIKVVSACGIHEVVMGRLLPFGRLSSAPM